MCDVCMPRSPAPLCQANQVTPAQVLEANARFVETFDKGGAQLPPSLPLAVLTCVDARLQPPKFLGLEIGDARVQRTSALHRQTDPGELRGV